MKFEYEKIIDYGPRDYQVFVSNRIELHKLSKIFCQSQITKRGNGPGTAFAKVLFQIEWPTNLEQHWGFELMRHFKGRNASRSAEAWCNYMLNNSPSTFNPTETHIEYGQEVNLQGEKLDDTYLPDFEKKMFCLVCGNTYSTEGGINSWEERTHFCPYCNKETRNIIIEEIN